MAAAITTPETGALTDSPAADVLLEGAETTPLPVLVGTGFAGTGFAGAGLADAGPAEVGPAETGLGGTGLPSSDSAGSRSSVGSSPRSHARRRPGRAGRAAADRLLAGPPTGALPAATRLLVTTPWFAAASGFVIAAALLIYAPHARFGLPDLAIGTVHCDQNGCAPQTDPQSAPSLAIASGQPIPPAHKSSAHPSSRGHATTRTAAAGLKFRYVVHPALNGSYAITVTVVGKHAIRNWKLSFVLPGDHILSLFGAHWQPAGTDGGTASPLTGAFGQQPSGGAGDTSGGAGSGGARAAGNARRVSFIVFTSGRAPVLTDCRYNGAACKFRRQTSK
jgi:hypothetical protein